MICCLQLFLRRYNCYRLLWYIRRMSIDETDMLSQDSPWYWRFSCGLFTIKKARFIYWKDLVQRNRKKFHSPLRDTNGKFWVCLLARVAWRCHRFCIVWNCLNIFKGNLEKECKYIKQIIFMGVSQQIVVFQRCRIRS